MPFSKRFKVVINIFFFIFLLTHTSNSWSYDNIWEWMPSKEELVKLYETPKYFEKSFTGKYDAKEFIQKLDNENSEAQLHAASILYHQSEYMVPSFKLTLRAMDDGKKDAFRMISFYQPFLRHKARSIFELNKEIELGNQMATFVLANLIEKETSPYYQKLTVKMYKKAVEYGISMAQHNLARKYMNGELVKKNQRKALALYRRAANQGSSKSIRTLIDILSKSNDLDALIEAYHWCLVWKKLGRTHKYLEDKLTLLKNKISEDEIGHLEYEIKYFDFEAEWESRSER